MADHPILFSAPMVRALLAGRKTQTRRIIKSARVFAHPERPAFTLRGADLDRALQNADSFKNLGGNSYSWQADAFEWQAPATRTTWNAHLGYAPGDRLWVREAWRSWWEYDSNAPSQIPAGAAVQYVADEPLSPWLTRYRPGIHMPRWASRLTLEVSGVRVERLQDISEADAWAEGCKPGLLDDYGNPFPEEEPHKSGIGMVGWDCARDWYADLWDEINGPDAWDMNPLVVAYSFDFHSRNIDRMGA